MLAGPPARYITILPRRSSPARSSYCISGTVSAYPANTTCASTDRRRIDARADDGVLAQHQFLGLAVAHQRQAGFRFFKPARMEADRLDVAVRAGRLQPRAFEFSGHIGGGFAITGAARIAALQFVVRQILDMAPPTVAIRQACHQRRGQQRAARRRQCNPSHHFLPFTFRYSSRMACICRAWLSACSASNSTWKRSVMGPRSLWLPVRA